MQVNHLRCEYLKNPLGLDCKKPRFSWILNKKPDDNEDSCSKFQEKYQIMVASEPELLEKEEPDMWDSQIIMSRKMTNVEYQGKDLNPHSIYYWKVKVWDNQGNFQDSYKSEVSYWSTGIISPENWMGEWVGYESTTRKQIEVIDTTKRAPIKIFESIPSHYLRKEFAIEIPDDTRIKHAFLRSTALGEYAAYLNGVRVGNSYFTPEWTDFNKRVLYQTFDIKDELKEGKNCIGAILSDGWYLGLLGPGDCVRQLYYGKERRFSCMICIELENGQKISMNSDETWMIFNEGPVRSADHFIGETYDSNKDVEGWSEPGFDSDGWRMAFVDGSISTPVQSQNHEPVQIFDEIKPIQMMKRPNGSFIFDMGQNMVGFCRITLSPKNGTKDNKITLKHGEMLNEDGSLHVDNLRLARQEDIYIANGKNGQIYQPQFTFHGFRYVEVQGLIEEPHISDLVGLAMSSNPEETGFISTSNDLVNKLFNNIRWTQRNNMLSVPTDCPQRNERMGWMGDIYAFCQTSIFNMNMAGFLTKFCQDIRDAQSPEGGYPDFAPHPMSWDKSMNSPGWADAGILLPWLMHVNYDDRRILEVSFDSMKDYIDLMVSWFRKDNFHFKGHNYGDWLNGNKIKSKDYPNRGGSIPKPAFALVLFLRSLKIFIKILKIIDKSELQSQYEDIYDEFHAKFLEKFVKFNFFQKVLNGKKILKSIAGKAQSSYALPLHYGLLDGEMEKAATDLMVSNLKEKYDGRMSTGFLSTTPMMLELSNRGHSDLSYTLLKSNRLPSWGYSIEQGATTIWERWDAYVKGRGFQSKGMNSFDHYAFGSVAEWMYKYMVGINHDEDKPGFTHFFIEPHLTEQIKHVEGNYSSIMGKISVKWEYVENSHKFKVSVEIPCNTTATLKLPHLTSQELNPGNHDFEVNR